MNDNKQLIIENNQERKKLTEDNLKVYEEVVVYLRAKLVSESQIEEVLTEILGHLIELQNNGGNHFDLFGANPKRYCQNLVKTIPKSKKNEKINLFFSVLLPVGAIILILSILENNFSLGSIFLKSLSLVCLIPVGLWIIRATAFMSKKRTFLYFFIFSLILISLLVGIELLTRP